MTALQLSAPTALIALLPLAGAIILLYLLKLRRRELVIPSIALWRRAIQDIQANIPFQKLKRNLLLFLQLLALTAVVLSLASPFILTQRLGGRSTVIVLDASASMSATDATDSRFEQARRLARRIINGMGRQDQTALIISAARARVAIPFSRDQKALLRAVAAARPTHCPTNMKDGLLLAISIAAKRPDAQIYVLSDGAFPPLPEVAASTEIHFLRLGERNDNVAILAFEASRQPGAAQHNLFLRIKNYAPEARQCVLSIYHDEELLDAQRLTLQPAESHIESYDMTLRQPGLLRAQLEADDDLKADNVAYTFAETAGALSILMITPGNIFLEQALVVLPEVQVHKTASLSADEAPGIYQKYDIVIFDRIAPPVPIASGALILIAAPDEHVAQLADSISAPTISRWQRQHPALRYVNFGAMDIAKGRALQPATGAQPLAWVGRHPFIVAQDAPGLRAIAFGFSFLDSDIPLRVGFPVLLSNCIEWLSEVRKGAGQVTLRPGSILRLRAPAGVSRVQVDAPDGTRQSLPVVEGEIAYTGIDRVGVYHLQCADRNWRVAADMRSDAESDLAPSEELKLGARRVQTTAGPPRVEQHLWPYLILLALLLLFGEWHLYHRRY